MDFGDFLLGRRVFIGSALGVAFGAGLGCGVACAAPDYPQLVDTALAVRNPTRVFMICGARAGARLFAGGEHGVIIYSDDAGQNWHQASVPVSVTITTIAFATPQVGWAGGGFGVVLGTTDGGVTWQKQLDGLQAIALMNAATQSFVAAQPPGSAPADHATRRAQILSAQGPDKPMLSLLPVSTTEIFAFGAYRFVEHSTDGGRSWTDWSMNIADPVSHNIYGAVAIGGVYYLVSEAGLVFRSTDGGRSFQQLAQPGQGTFFGICDAGNGGMLAYGVAGQMFLSTDAGQSWTASNFAGTANINCVVRFSSGVLLAGDAGGGMWVSLDHGRNFKLGARNPLISVNALQPIDATQFLILSDIGVIKSDLSTMR